jgi:hypothetical protein
MRNRIRFAERSEYDMDHALSRTRILTGLTAAAVAFGVAVGLAAGTAPAAHADLYDDMIDVINWNLSHGQTAFELATADFGAGEATPGLAALIDGLNDDFHLAPQNVSLGILDTLTNEPFSGERMYYLLTVPTDFAQAEILAHDYVSYATGDLINASNYFAVGDYGLTAYFDFSAFNDGVVVPAEYLLLGVAASF